jgi:acyl dehydratase
VYEDVPVDDEPKPTEVATKAPLFGELIADGILLRALLVNVLSGAVEADVAAASNAVIAN